MTTIAFDGVSLSCDSQSTSGGNKELGSIKIIERLFMATIAHHIYNSTKDLAEMVKTM